MSDSIRSISQNNFILADQKEVSHDNTLSGNGTEESPLKVAKPLDETVLFSNSSGVDGSHLPSGMTNMNTFKYVRITMAGYSNKIGGYTKKVVTFSGNSPYFEIEVNYWGSTIGYVILKNNGTSIGYNSSSVGRGGEYSGDDPSRIRVYEVVGIN